MKQDYSFHTHTKRCGHAVGNDEDYIKAGIRQGFTYFGFSDHIMLPYHDDPAIRGNYALYFQDYLDCLRNLRGKYKEFFDIQIGFEAEWFGDTYRDYYAKLLKNDIDYLILGQHCFMEDNRIRLYGRLPYPEARSLYVKHVCEAMESGLFLYFAHPDFIFRMRREVEEGDEEAARTILECAARTHTPIEINLGPKRWDRRRKGQDGEWVLAYPHPFFWDLAKDYDVEVVIGPDVHDPSEFAMSDYEWGMEMAISRGLRLLSGKELYERIRARFEK